MQPADPSPCGLRMTEPGLCATQRYPSLPLHLARKTLLLNDSRSFFHIDQLIGRDIFECVHTTAWPADFNQIHLLGFAQAKVNTQIILGKITAAAAHFINLLHGCLHLRRAAYTFDSRADPAAV